MRRIAFIVVILLLIGGVALAITPLELAEGIKQNITTAQTRLNRGDIDGAQVALNRAGRQADALIEQLSGDTSTTSTTSTTTSTSTTTTTTTTTIPETVPHPSISGNNGYIVALGQIDSRLTPEVEPGESWWHAPYVGIGQGNLNDPVFLPYAENVYWNQGDRIGYECDYGFLVHNGQLIGRFTFVTVPAASAYARILDFAQPEGDYYYDGTKTPFFGDSQGQAYRVGLCETLVEQDYQPATVDERPRIVFWTGDNQVAEIRDYRGVDAHPLITFELVGTSGPFLSCDGGFGNPQGTAEKCIQVNNRATVLARRDGVPVIVVYYDSLGAGRVTADLP